MIRPVATDTRSADIRRFYLSPQATYTCYELAALWRVGVDDVRAIYHDDLATWNEEHPEETDQLPIASVDAHGASVAFNILRPGDVERALGSDFDRVRPASWRTTPVLLEIPRWLVAALEHDDTRIPLTSRGASLALKIERALLDLFEDERFERFPLHRNAAQVTS